MSLDSTYNNVLADARDFARKVAELEAENIRLRAALEQYADGGNWAHPGFGFPGAVAWRPTDDGYTPARRALGMEESNAE